MDSLSQEIAIIIIASAFLLMVAVAVIILFLVYQKKQLKYLLERKEMNSQFQKELLKTRLESQEETLTKLGAELHDNIGQLLSSSKLLIGVAGRDLHASSEPLRMADETISKAIRELRSMSKSLNTEWLEQFSLIENLHAEAARVNASGDYQVSVSHSPSFEMPSDRQIILFRMVQEALQNAIRHGLASQITIQATQSNEGSHITIVDNGKGFNLEATKQGVGMLNIKHRAQIMGGSAQWTSNENGTSVFIHLMT
jgi:signal transduction histidine kinase